MRGVPSCCGAVWSKWAPTVDARSNGASVVDKLGPGCTALLANGQSLPWLWTKSGPTVAPENLSWANAGGVVNGAEVFGTTDRRQRPHPKNKPPFDQGNPKKRVPLTTATTHPPSSAEEKRTFDHRRFHPAQSGLLRRSPLPAPLAASPEALIHRRESTSP